jgi:hypothetical protein
MKKQTRHRLRTAALISAVLGLYLTIMALAPAAMEQTAKAEETIAKPSIEALKARDASEGLKTPVMPSIPSRIPKRGNAAPSKGARTIKTTCYTDVDSGVHGNATKQGILVGEVATNLAPQGSLVRIGRMLHRVHSWPDENTQADIFYGFTKADQARCVVRGVQYLNFEIVSS